MAPTQNTSLKPTPPIQRFRLGQVLAVGYLAAWGLVIAGSLGYALGFLAFHADKVRPFDWRLVVNESRAVMVHYGPVCMPMPGTPAGACADYVPDLNEFSLIYSAAGRPQVLASALVPVR
jgi:hypothetical protein